MSRDTGSTAIGQHDGFMTAVHLSDDALTRRHSMPMARVVIPVEGQVEVRTARAVRRSHLPLVTAAHEACVVGSYGRSVTIFMHLLAPQARTPQQLPAATLRKLCGAAKELRDVQRDSQGLLREVVPMLNAGAPRLDRRVEKAARWLEQHPTERWSMSCLASLTGLSKSRLAHLFHAHLGTSARTLALFQRTLAALNLSAADASLAAAAQHAGFSDQAHFTRSCVRYLGQTPATLRDGTIVQA